MPGNAYQLTINDKLIIVARLPLDERELALSELPLSEAEFIRKNLKVISPLPPLTRFEKDVGELLNRYYIFANENAEVKVHRDYFFDKMYFQCTIRNNDDALKEIEASVREKLKIFNPDGVDTVMVCFEDIVKGLVLIAGASLARKTDEDESRRLLAKSQEIISRLEILKLANPIKKSIIKEERKTFAKKGAKRNGQDCEAEKELMRRLILEKCVDGFRWKDRTVAAKQISSKILELNKVNGKSKRLTESNVLKLIGQWIAEYSDELDLCFIRESRKKK